MLKLQQNLFYYQNTIRCSRIFDDTILWLIIKINYSGYPIVALWFVQRTITAFNLVFQRQFKMLCYYLSVKINDFIHNHHSWFNFTDDWCWPMSRSFLWYTLLIDNPHGNIVEQMIEDETARFKQAGADWLYAHNKLLICKIRSKPVSEHSLMC